MSAVIHSCVLNSQVEQFAWIVEEITRLRLSGQKLSQIAVISRKHKSLMEISQYLQVAEIPVFYEKRQNILDKPQIQQLLTMLKFTHSISQKKLLEADELLPEILAYPFWGIARKDLWLLSVFSSKLKGGQSKMWLDIMQTPNEIEVSGQKLKNPEKFKLIADFFIALSGEAKFLPLEQLIDILIGSNELGLAQNEQEDDNELDWGNLPNSPQTHILSLCQTNFKKYYFDSRLDLNKHKVSSEAVSFLSNLRTLFGAIRQHRSTETLYLTDLINFINLLEKNHLPLNDNSPFGSQNQAVNLLTAYKSKGLEFEIVFVIDCNENDWFANNHSNNLDLPINLPFLAENDDLDDRIRLLYVAITRAKNKIYFTRYENDDGSKKKLSIDILQNALDELGFGQNVVADTNNPLPALNLWVKTTLNLDFTATEQELLMSTLDNYQLSATHLNNFLDITKGGPRQFLQQNLLQFPQAKNAKASYGTAMHAAIRAILTEYKTKGIYPNMDFVIDVFEQKLALERMSNQEFQEFFELGKSNLSIYCDYRKNRPKRDFYSEFNFVSEEVCLNQARLKGQIDLIEILPNDELLVIDFKTGKTFSKWQVNNDYDKIRLWTYKNQLIFYKILIENSRTFGGKYKVNVGELEFLNAHEAPNKDIICLKLDINLPEFEEFTKLVEIVFNKITSLDFPDTSHYPQNYQGIQQFIADLLNKKI